MSGWAPTLPIAATRSRARKRPVTRDTTVPAAITRLAERMLDADGCDISREPSGRHLPAGSLLAANAVHDAVAGRDEQDGPSDAHDDPDHEADLGGSHVEAP